MLIDMGALPPKLESICFALLEPLLCAHIHDKTRRLESLAAQCEIPPSYFEIVSQGGGIACSLPYFHARVAEIHLFSTRGITPQVRTLGEGYRTQSLHVETSETPWQGIWGYR